MARHRDTRSPSPAGSSYSSKRDRRNGDYYDRSRHDDDRSYRRRSRSRSPERRHHRARDSHRSRDHSRDRQGRDGLKSRHRDSSRDRRRSRERDSGRDYRRRSRERDYRDRRDASTERDRNRRHRDGSADSRRSGRRRDTRDSRDNHAPSSAKTETAKLTPAVADEENKKARLAKLEAWKQKQKAEQEKKKQAESAIGTRDILDAIDKKAAASPQSASTPDPITPSAPYAGKFDPKAIAKKAATASVGSSKLGIDVMLPEQHRAQAVSGSKAVGSKADVSSTTASLSSGTTFKNKGNLSGFGLSSKNLAESTAPKRGLAFDDEEGSRKKLEKLPTPPPNSAPLNNEAGAADAETPDEEDDDVEIEGGTEEEAAAAARAAAEKREERLQAQNAAYQEEISAVPTVNGENSEPQETTAPEPMDTSADPGENEEEEEVDPLDAFMTGLADGPIRPSLAAKRAGKPSNQAPQAMFGDDEVEMGAIESNPDDILAMAHTKKKKKEVPAVNHANIAYEPFDKKVYFESPDLRDLSPDEISELRLELGDIKIQGVDVPTPTLKWSQCGFNAQISQVISKRSYDEPSAIQAQAIPCIMSGRDVIGVAKTGSGKTIAFLLPMFRHIKAQRPLGKMEGPVGLVVTPTRELATQIHDECKPFLKGLDLRAVCAYGGAQIKDQIAALKTGAEIVICTPGRMIDLLRANSGRVVNLRRVTYVAIDESDRMFDMGFKPQVKMILDSIRPDRQTVLFSATFTSEMEDLARKALTNPVTIVVGGRSVVAPEITQIVEVRAKETKFNKLLEILGRFFDKDENEDNRVLIFVNNQETADSLMISLNEKQYVSMSIHGGRDQIDRDSTINDFKTGALPILIATSVAARGLDVKQLRLVVNYDAPNHLEDYVHRVGRTGRAGNTGTAVTFVSEDEDAYAVGIAKALKQSDQSVPEDLQRLVDRHLENVKAGKAKSSGGGFGGKGLEKLDQERDAARTRERKAYKTGEEGEEEEEKEEKKKEEDEAMFAKAASSVRAANAPAPAPLPGVPKGIDLDGKITVHKSETVSGSASGSALDKVSQAVAKIASRIHNPGHQPQAGVSIDNRGPDAGAFHATLEINDFPQKARWAVTNRTNVAKILEATGTSITTKGSYYGAGKEPQAGENPKLYILVEGDTEVVVTNAMRELMRLLKEGTMAAADTEARPSGRYSVI